MYGKSPCALMESQDFSIPTRGFTQQEIYEDFVGKWNYWKSYFLLGITCQEKASEKTFWNMQQMQISDIKMTGEIE